MSKSGSGENKHKTGFWRVNSALFKSPKSGFVSTFKEEKKGRIIL